MLTMAEKSGNESAAFTYNWAAVVDCDTFSFDHYRVCRLAGSTAPTTPTTTGAVCNLTATTRTSVTGSDFVHRSDKQYAATVFACDNATCTDWHGKTGHGTTSNSEASDATVKERWVLEDISSYSDTDRVIDDEYANASAALVYPTGFADAGKLGIWWSTQTGGVDVIRHRKASYNGWTSWNTTTSWSSDTTVTESTGPSATTDFGVMTHPWVMAAKRQVGETWEYFIWLFIQGDDDGDPTTNDPFSGWSLESTDSAGTSYGVTCTTGGGCSAGGATCANTKKCDFDGTVSGNQVAVKELCSDGTSACDYATNLGHSRTGHDYIANGALNLAVDEPFMVVTGSRDASCATYPDSATVDDLYTAWWNTSAGAFELDTSGSCPVDVLEDVHDPGLIPLPGGEFKVYYRVGKDHYEVCYGDGTSFGDCAEVEFAFHSAYDPWGSLDANLGECLENIDTLVHVSGGTVTEGGFVRAGAENTAASNSCFDCTNCVQGILYIEHRN